MVGIQESDPEREEIILQLVLKRDEWFSRMRLSAWYTKENKPKQAALAELDAIRRRLLERLDLPPELGWRRIILSAAYAAMADCDDHGRNNAYMDAWFLFNCIPAPAEYRAESLFACATIRYAQKKYEEALMLARKSYHLCRESSVKSFAWNMIVRINWNVPPE